ncbi:MULTISPECIES: sulfotransferase [unclassified Ruegeria]|uniref:sulfotransferase n=1 Tax=unclassified Ruegeria TaxID=2625375 RepID=UPI001AEB816D|nr:MULTISPECIES: sulfotransferase [unclassified Ruegeria]
MIIILAVSLLAVGGFAFVLWRTNIFETANDVVSTSMTGVTSLMDSQLSDYAKEQAVRRAGLKLIVGGFNIAWRVVLALAAAGLPIFLAEYFGVTTSSAVFDVMLRLDYIVIVSIVAIAAVKTIQWLRPVAAAHDADNTLYSPVEQFVHSMAFSGPVVLKAAAWAEEKLSSQSHAEEVTRPVFVTSLARGGTTAVLNALHDASEIATHIYRDMPFLTAPLLWNRLAGGQRRGVRRRQRAHGDGLEIDLDSPEAFEEVIWKMFWPQHYQASSIPLWTAENTNLEADQFLRRHMSKIVRARSVQAGPEVPRKTRYCSKNNANIARIPYLLNAFPDCRIVVPVRRPESHAHSLLRQHRNFCTQQSEDVFIARYMADIGHYEFGKIHKPFLFSGFDPERYSADTIDYWLDYWTHAFRHVLRHRDKCIILLQDNLRSSPGGTMTALYQALDLEPGEHDFGRYFHSKQDLADTKIFAQGKFRDALDVYDELEKCALSFS